MVRHRKYRAIGANDAYGATEPILPTASTPTTSSYDAYGASEPVLPNEAPEMREEVAPPMKMDIPTIPTIFQPTQASEDQVQQALEFLKANGLDDINYWMSMGTENSNMLGDKLVIKSGLPKVAFQIALNRLKAGETSSVPIPTLPEEKEVSPVQTPTNQYGVPEPPIYQPVQRKGVVYQIPEGASTISIQKITSAAGERARYIEESRQLKRELQRISGDLAELDSNFKRGIITRDHYEMMFARLKNDDGMRKISFSKKWPTGAPKDYVSESFEHPDALRAKRELDNVNKRSIAEISSGINSLENANQDAIRMHMRSIQYSNGLDEAARRRKMMPASIQGAIDHFEGFLQTAVVSGMISNVDASKRLQMAEIEGVKIKNESAPETKRDFINNLIYQIHDIVRGNVSF